MTDTEKTGRYIMMLRREKGYTGEKFAEIIGVTPQAVSKWENGRSLPDTAILLDIASALGTTVDALLSPNDIIILSAHLTDGVSDIDVTRAVCRHVFGNSLSITVNKQYLGSDIETERLKILTVKYQTPNGVFYSYAVENTVLEVTVCSGISDDYSEISLKVVDAYYGNNETYKSAMIKMNHYEYFRWNQIHVNHESFPSSTDTDKTEYLTLIYQNKSGLHVISCPEEQSLSYSSDFSSLYLTDESESKVLDGIMTLEWEKGMDCTWAGAVYAALSYMGEVYTYEEIMGMSGACYRLAFCDVWDWSAADALVAFPYCDVLFRAIGYDEKYAERLEKDERSAERELIVQDINRGVPVIAINLRIAPEWGVITGYCNHGKTLLCRTYFDKEYLDEDKNYLEADFWPFLITHFGEKIQKPSDKETFLASLKCMKDSLDAPCNRGYFQGREAYERWICGLLDDSQWDKNLCSENDIKRRLSVNDSLLLNLIDARRCASVYIEKHKSLLGDQYTGTVTEISDIFKSIAEKLSAFRKMLHESGNESLRYNTLAVKGESSRDVKSAEAEILSQSLMAEEKIYKLIESLGV